MLADQISGYPPASVSVGVLFLLRWQWLVYPNLWRFDLEELDEDGGFAATDARRLRRFASLSA